MGLGGLVLGSLILYIKGMRILMFQLSGFYYSTQRLHIWYHYGIRPQKTILIRALGT